jgi:hypothetical protein
MDDAESPTELPFRVEPPYLIVPSHTYLPQRCVVTNEPVSDSEYQIWNLPRIRWGLMVAIPVLWLFTPFIGTPCKLKVGLCRQARRKRLPLKAAIVVAIWSPFLSFIAGVLTGQFVFIQCVAVLLVAPYFAVPALAVYGPPLRVHRRDGDLYWITGCSPEFLASVELAISEMSQTREATQ